MQPNKTTIQCPECGSKKTKYLDDNVFECLNCHTSFYIETNQTVVKHNHTYNHNGAQQNSNSASFSKKVFIVLGILMITLVLISLLFNLIGNHRSSAFETKEVEKKGNYVFDINGSVPFVDKSGYLKVFILGQPNNNDYQNKKYNETYFWAIYDPLKNGFEQINQIQNVTKTGYFSPHHGSVFKFDDGNVYFILNDNLLYKYDTSIKNIQSLNEDMIATISELKSGIKSISGITHKFSGFDIESNSEKKLTYFPISKTVNIDNFEITSKKQSYPNDKTATFFFQTDSEPSFLVKYNAMYSMGYPFCFDPNIGVSFDENENFVSASFSNYWVTASRLIDLKVLNTDNKVYDMTVLDFRDDRIAMGIKTNNSKNDPFILQWLDYEGNLLWSVPLNDSGLYDLSGALSKNEGVLFAPCCEKYLYYDSSGKLIRSFKTDELTFNLD